LEPDPPLLHILSSFFHVLLLLDLRKLLFLFLTVDIVLFLLDHLKGFEIGVHRLDLMLSRLLVFVDLVSDFLQLLDLLVLADLNILHLVFVVVVGLVVVLLDLPAHFLLDFDLLTQVCYLIGEAMLFHLLPSLHTGDGTGDDTLRVLHLQFGLSLRLVDVLLQLTDVFYALLSLGGELFVVLLEFFLKLLDLFIAELLFLLELVETAVFFTLTVDVIFEINILVVFFHLVHKVMHFVDNGAAMQLDHGVVAGGVRIVVQLTAELEGRGF
jgi:hypothetical protein